MVRKRKEKNFPEMLQVSNDFSNFADGFGGEIPIPLH